MNGTKEESTRLVVLPTKAKKIGYVEIDKENNHGGHDDNQQQQQVNIWKAIALVSMVLLVNLVVITNPGNLSSPTQWMLLRNRNSPKCQFCDQSPPEVHYDKSYTIINGVVGLGQGLDGVNNDDDGIIVTPMTITYEYELYDGQNIFTNGMTELIPNLDFDYAVLSLSAARNINRETNEPVSLDEVYLHHFTFLPLNMVGAEVLTRDETMPYMRFPDGYALHVIVDETPHIKTNAHLLSNKDLAPISGSLSRAHKECNECFYAPGKGSDCTPEVSGTFRCCGDSFACTVGGEQCACATNAETDISQTTKYRIEVDLLISKDVNKFKRIDQWTLAAPACAVNLNGDAVFEEYPPDNYCFNNTDSLVFGDGSLFHSVPEDDVNPYLKTKINVLAPAGGSIFWAQSHLHSGGINGTLLLNGEVICTAGTVYGTDSNKATNARNEQNHVIQVEPCYSEIGERGIRFEQGDVFTTESFYYGGTDDERMDGIDAAGEHKNVMSMFGLGVVFDGDADYITEKRTSFNLWNNFVHIAGYHGRKSAHQKKGKTH